MIHTDGVRLRAQRLVGAFVCGAVRVSARMLVAAGMLGLPAAVSASHPPEYTMAERQPPVVGRVVTGRYDGVEGTRAWRLYVPSRYDAARPPMMVVLLHGCTQNADDVARGSQMDLAAEERGVLVLYPEQSAAANPRTCWNWFDAAHQQRGAGEPALLAALIANVIGQYPADPKRVHLAGISAGAAMATLVAVAYPERFASVSSASGIAWGAAKNVGAALSVMQKGAGESLPTAQAVIAAMGTHARAMPLLVVHGGKDAVVSVRNADETADQMVSVHGALGGTPLQVATEATVVDGGYTVRRTLWRRGSASPLVSKVIIDELGHAWSGGSTTGTFADAKGPNASRLMLAFCEQHRTP